MIYTAALFASLALSVAAQKNSRTFAVAHFRNTLTVGRLDPIVSPGKASSHVHHFMGGNGLNLTMEADSALDSTCTTALLKNDKSLYWFPTLWFYDNATGLYEEVTFDYFNAYYFFEATDDKIEAFPPGLRIVSGNPNLRTPPSTGGGIINVVDNNHPVAQPVQITCPRANYNPPSWPANSNGLDGVGIGDPNVGESGAGFPDRDCDALYSPMRLDVHFPSCYNPAVALDDYQHNMQFPSGQGTTGGKANCPPGWKHLPHLFYEAYFNTHDFASRWTQGEGHQPWRLSMNDPTGYGHHADFFAGWDVETLQQIIDTCDAGDSGMENCANIIGGLNDPSDHSCTLANPVPEQVTGTLTALPGNPTYVGWGGTIAAAAPSETAKAVSSPSSASQAAASSKSPVATQASSPTKAPGAAPTASTPNSVPKASVSSVSVKSQPTTTLTKTTTLLTTVDASAPAPPAATSPSSIGPSKSAPGIVDISGWTYNGCWSDNLDTRVLTGITFANIGNKQVTSTKCINYCQNAGFSIAGTEYGGQCFCGNQLASISKQLDESHCKMPCEGNGVELCGGSLALSVYKTAAQAKSGSKASKAHLHRHSRRSARY